MTMTAELPIRRCRPSEDTIPFSECRNNFSAIIAKANTTRRPILVTQNGRAASYIVDAGAFDDLMDRIELSSDVELSRREIAEGRGIPNELVFDRLHAKLLDLQKQGKVA